MMSTKVDFRELLDEHVETLAKDTIKMYEGDDSSSYVELPSLTKIKELVDVIKAIIFPGFFGDKVDSTTAIKYHIGVLLERLYPKLERQISICMAFECKEKKCDPQMASRDFIARLSHIKELLYSDVEATLKGDPAATSHREIILCYPGIVAITHHRIAHELLRLGSATLARIISEMAHSQTGIDIHPGAKIGGSFCIDHGTGVVIGETCVIGNGVKIYQGVTLGARSFVKDSEGNLLNTPRHPTIEDNVTIYSNASILGNIVIGKGSVIGGNIWLTEGIPAGSRVVQSRDCKPIFSKEIFSK